MPKNQTNSAPDAEIIALQSLNFLASDPDRISRFMAITGLQPQDIRSRAGEAPFLAGLLDYLRGDQGLLLTFAESAALDPAEIDAAYWKLTGGRQ